VQIEHVYQQVGVYGAKLTVKDARGLVSSNTDLKMIEVVATGTPPVEPPAGDPTATASGRFGGALGLLLLPLLLSAAAVRRGRGPARS
ncbi:MAG: hypothetical protein Q8Q73_03340, partial [Stagnimonas sp.]|nr:hypothetical protein [Stagnimonas sp.]